jgi:carboxymethylenebutenolidase
LDGGNIQQDFVAAAQWLKARPDSSGRLGAVGFCFGGGIVHIVSIRVPDLAAGVPFYGPTPDPREAAKVKAQLVQQAEVDERSNA